MTESIKLKYDKYWSRVERMNILIYILVILDLFFKSEVVELPPMLIWSDKGKIIGLLGKDLVY